MGVPPTDAQHRGKFPRFSSHAWRGAASDMRAGSNEQVSLGDR